MPKFIVTHGSISLSSDKTVAAGQSFEASPEAVEGAPNVLPFVDGEMPLADFAALGMKPSAWHQHLVNGRAKKAAEKVAPKADAPNGK